MTRLLVGVVWVSVSALRFGPAALTSSASTQNQPPNATAGDTDFNWPFLQLRADLPAYSQPIRPYALTTNAEDHHYMPKPRHRHPSRLLRLLGSSLDLFWMSIEKPSEASGGHGDGEPAREKCNLNASSVLREAAAKQRRGLEGDAAGLDLDSLPAHVARSVRDRLVRSATCGLSCQWVDLGPAFWPRWLRRTDCERSDGVRSCSFPGGMACVRAQTTRIKILAWNCLAIREGDNGSLKAGGSDGNAAASTGERRKRCVWRRLPYPVVTSCTCSCE
ncbi:noggin-like [Brachionichthys hirsutus]|uniref:noggin-like n=1 Tax=Brachionichthys hirsutus TaxID=412623 RepID=UPI003604B52F